MFISVSKELQGKIVQRIAYSQGGVDNTIYQQYQELLNSTDILLRPKKATWDLTTLETRQEITKCLLFRVKIIDFSISRGTIVDLQSVDQKDSKI